MSDAEHDHDRASDAPADDAPKRVINYISIRQFVEQGYLQEVNRQFLHPLGLALEVKVGEGTPDELPPYELGGVWDYRDDPEGMRFADNTMEFDKYERVRREQEGKKVLREAALGYVIQPPPTAPVAD